MCIIDRYKVAIGDIEDNIAHVEVNGTPYKVEMAVSYTHLAVYKRQRKENVQP